MKIKNEADFVRASSYRTKILKSIASSPKISTRIAKDTGIRTNHISKVLTELASKDLIVCINPEVRKGRLYKITSLGSDVLEHIPIHLNEDCSEYYGFLEEMEVLINKVDSNALSDFEEF